ncbi:hypothetical protein BAE44_0017398 [Dichanthelium oligosanthes]|uniref:Uncharacterized protein n=1 Tax=Dichanthelium oligosanthes TaxID=888268 RepID=A0A1E5V8Z0_9POAL|nr:hypothetical protein BAE44_0017398 [Dichanthelium oligosanthes]
MAAAAAHVLVFPSPVQDHITCMLHLARGLASVGVHVTFLHTDHHLRRLGHGGVAHTASQTTPRLRFLSVPDGLPVPGDQPRSLHRLTE